jgi:transcriptional regulator with XRE-family HTH domain
MSPTDEVASPIFSPITDRVSPASCKSLILLAQVFLRVAMARILRLSVINTQRHSVTEIRLNDRVTIGERIKGWRETRKLTVEQLAVKVGLRPTTIYDLERGDSKSTKRLHVIADVLRVNVNYLETGKGAPEDLDAPRYQSPKDSWPFAFDRARFDSLNTKDRGAIEAAVLALVERLEKTRSHPQIKKKAV